MTQMVFVHKWQDAGVGQAPFTFQYMFDAGSVKASCDVCSAGIRYQFWIADAAGKLFKVGCDCVAKTDDTKLMTDVENAKRLHEKQVKEEKRQAAWAKKCADRDAAIQLERDENGGFTLAEIDEMQKAGERAASAKKFREVNRAILDILATMPGDFCESMFDKLETGYVRDLSERMINILRDIYAKEKGGRRGSKKYQTAADEFDLLYGV